MGLGMKLMTAAMKFGTAVLSAGGDVATGFDIAAIMQDSVNTVQGQAFSVLKIVVPAIVLITGATVGIKYGIGWLRRVKG